MGSLREIRGKQTYPRFSSSEGLWLKPNAVKIIQAQLKHRNNDSQCQRLELTGCAEAILRERPQEDEL